MKVLITGGAGFIGSNVANRLIHTGHMVTIVDDLSRPGAGRNLEWLQSLGEIEFQRTDIRNNTAVRQILRSTRFEVVIHLAAQVAVTSSVVDPWADFEINAMGTLNLLEAVREFCPDSVVLYASTNKVYGYLSNRAVKQTDKRYILEDSPDGISESQPLDFFSPYGCSKGSADQYVLDYARIYGLRTVVFRQSCIYGYRQFGIEDQGWIAWFMLAHLLGKAITIYGNGKQVRDILFVDDLVNLYMLAISSIDRVSGYAFNIGGGSTNALSILEFLGILGQMSNRAVCYSFQEQRPGDQMIYISDNSLAQGMLGWLPQVNYEHGIQLLYHWINDNKQLFE